MTVIDIDLVAEFAHKLTKNDHYNRYVFFGKNGATVAHEKPQDQACLEVTEKEIIRHTI